MAALSDAALLAEFNTDPVSMGYAAAGWSSDPPSAAQYQAVADLANGLTRAQDRPLVPGWEVFAAIVASDFMALYTSGDEAHRSYMNAIFVLSDVPLGDAGVRASFSTIFAGMTGTLSALSALETQAISRMAELGGSKVKTGDLKRIKEAL